MKKKVFYWSPHINEQIATVDVSPRLYISLRMPFKVALRKPRVTQSLATPQALST